MTPQETDPDLSMSVQESPAETWVSSGLLQGWGHTAVHAWDLFKDIAFIFITFIIVWPQVKQQGVNTAPSINRKFNNLIKDLLSMALSIRT